MLEPSTLDLMDTATTTTATRQQRKTLFGRKPQVVKKLNLMTTQSMKTSPQISPQCGSAVLSLGGESTTACSSAGGGGRMASTRAGSCGSRKRTSSSRNKSSPRGKSSPRCKIASPRGKTSPHDNRLKDTHTNKGNRGNGVVTFCAAFSGLINPSPDWTTSAITMGKYVESFALKGFLKDFLMIS